MTAAMVVATLSESKVLKETLAAVAVAEARFERKSWSVTAAEEVLVKSTVPVAVRPETLLMLPEIRTSPWTENSSAGVAVETPERVPVS